MKLKNRILSGACAAALTLALAVPAFAYDDVPEKHWAAADIKTATELELMTGGTGGFFYPEGLVTRATVLTTLWRLEDSPKAETETPFPDIPEKHWAYAAAVWAKENGIATGGSGGVFSPDDTVTREQLAVFLYRYAVYKGQDIAEGVVDLYPDVDSFSSWALDGVRHAIGAGLITGVTGGAFSPGGQATRAELAKILVRLTTPVQG